MVGWPRERNQQFVCRQTEKNAVDAAAPRERVPAGKRDERAADNVQGARTLSVFTHAASTPPRLKKSPWGRPGSRRAATCTPALAFAVTGHSAIPSPHRPATKGGLRAPGGASLPRSASRGRRMSDVTGDTAAEPTRPARTNRLRGGDLARRRLALWGSTLLVLGWVGHGWQIAVPGLATRMGEVKGADYIQFYIMGGRVREGRSDLLYNMEHIATQAKRRISPRLEYHPERNPYRTAGGSCLRAARGAVVPDVAGLVLTRVPVCVCRGRVAAVATRRTAGARRIYVACVAAAYPALLVTLRFGQISTLTLLAPALAVSALAAERRVVAGLCLGLLAYKPQLLVVTVPVLLLARDWRAIGGLIAAGAAQLAIAWAGVGTATMQRYMQTLDELTRHPDLVMLHPRIHIRSGEPSGCSVRRRAWRLQWASR